MLAGQMTCCAARRTPSGCTKTIVARLRIRVNGLHAVAVDGACHKNLRRARSRAVDAIEPLVWAMLAIGP